MSELIAVAFLIAVVTTAVVLLARQEAKLEMERAIKAGQLLAEEYLRKINRITKG